MRIFRIFTLLMIVACTITTVNAQQDIGQECGCPPVSSRTVENFSTNIADANGDIIADNTILTCDKIWLLDDKVYVGDGQKLTIQPGTVIKGKSIPSDAAALIISRGGQIIAAGTRECPIVFTAEADMLDGTYSISNKGQWGGVILLGKAKNNLVSGSGTLYVSDGVGFIEGFVSADPRILFGAAPGAEDDNDNSGVMTYVSIRHGGEVVGAANEINGLTLGSVGRGTTLNHIEVLSNNDDGIEFFGGTVDLKYASVMFVDDDGFDWDLGYEGRGQFWSVVKADFTSAPNGDNGFELDGDDGDDGSFLGNPVVFNATVIGAVGANGEAADGNRMIEMKEATRGEIYNSVFAGYTGGIRFDNESTHLINGAAANDALEAWRTDGTLKLINNTFIASGSSVLNADGGGTITAADETKFTNDGNVLVASVPGFNATRAITLADNTVTTKLDQTPNPSLGSVTTPPVDGFFTPTTFRGAFESGVKSWLSEYSFNALIELEDNLLPCPVDITGDGVVSTADFNALLGAFGSTCK